MCFFVLGQASNDGEKIDDANVNQVTDVVVMFYTMDTSRWVEEPSLLPLPPFAMITS
jgi:hypothetical protein